MNISRVEIWPRFREAWKIFKIKKKNRILWKIPNYTHPRNLGFQKRIFWEKQKNQILRGNTVIDGKLNYLYGQRVENYMLKTENSLHLCYCLSRLLMNSPSFIHKSVVFFKNQEDGEILLKQKGKVKDYLFHFSCINFSN